MDVTLLLMVADNPVPDSANRWRQGEVINVLPFNGLPAQHPRFTHLHVTSIPDSFNQQPITFQRIKETLERQHTDGASRLPAAPDEADLARRRWVLDFGVLNPPQLNDITAGRSLTLTMNQLKARMRKRSNTGTTLADFINETDFFD